MKDLALTRPLGGGMALAVRLGAALLALAVTGCGGAGTEVVTTSSADPDWDWAADAGLPSHFPVPAVPADNPMSRAKVALGRQLFFDKRLSGNGQQACAGCHVQALGFTDGRATALGSTGEAHPRNAQGLANVAFHATLTWANPLLQTLERQMEVPLFGENPVEMGINNGNQDTVLARFRGDSAYPALFAAAFPDEAGERITFRAIIKAIAAFERSLISADSRYDRWQQGREVLTEQELRGMALFNGEKAECFHCHAEFNFNDQVRHAGSRTVSIPFHNTGLYNIDGAGGFPFPNRGVFEVSQKPADMGMFRAPSLRNVAVTAPYMHDGSKATLEDVLDHYANGGTVIATGPHAGDGRANPYKSDLVSRIDLSVQDKADLVAFLKTLTDETFLAHVRHADPFAAARLPATAAQAGGRHAR
ncbi:methanobactin export MATE transporter MbnM [Ideonella livida]|uniref:Di-heme enzyme n=1 Tax=Ideonella livida TaxID=2707176 RepID=A0A7C9TMT9_9BURK|nr:methanobactin export MATE transporter MbnM [Ideonella livida]NDY91926.1 di-heme enzyme [Ideonella livida]